MLKPRGLTLLEVIVVLVMIAVLAGLLLPTLQRTRCGGSRSSCSSNLNQIAKACFMYADVPANGGYFPVLGTGDEIYKEGMSMRALSLVYNSYVADVRVFSCDKKPIPPATLASITPVRDGKLDPGGTYLSAANCSYEYDAGHPSDHALAAILADKKGSGHNSDNHGPNAGQNVVIGAGTTEWMPTVYRNLGNGHEDQDIHALDAKLSREMDGYIRQ
ncbi:MAG TPA: type II secretion system protein [Planctomycetota bacterium]|jgi:prepilin-type N-terminal cleavage/methylation domain-containing protein